jgi:hypothetical protein
MPSSFIPSVCPFARNTQLIANPTKKVTVPQNGSSVLNPKENCCSEPIRPISKKKMVKARMNITTIRTIKSTKPAKIRLLRWAKGKPDTGTGRVSTCDWGAA